MLLKIIMAFPAAMLALAAGCQAQQGPGEPQGPAGSPRPVNDPEGEDASFACSELVLRAWEIAGAPLIDKPAHLLAPNILFKTRRLAMLGRLL